MVNRCYNRPMGEDKMVSMKDAAKRANMDPAALRRRLQKLVEAGELPGEAFRLNGKGYEVNEWWLRGWLACKKLPPHEGAGRPTIRPRKKPTAAREGEQADADH